MTPKREVRGAELWWASSLCPEGNQGCLRAQSGKDRRSQHARAFLTGRDAKCGSRPQVHGSARVPKHSKLSPLCTGCSFCLGSLPSPLETLVHPSRPITLPQAGHSLPPTPITASAGTGKVPVGYGTMYARASVTQQGLGLTHLWSPAPHTEPRARNPNREACIVVPLDHEAPLPLWRRQSPW